MTWFKTSIQPERRNQRPVWNLKEQCAYYDIDCGQRKFDRNIEFDTIACVDIQPDMLSGILNRAMWACRRVVLEHNSM